MPCLDETLPTRFWKKVDKRGPDECWFWTGAIERTGLPYGFIGVPKGMEQAHRVSYRLNNGPIPPGMCVCHECDQPLCVNPEHLWLGTRKDNNDDKMKKGRHVGGENAPDWGEGWKLIPPPATRSKISFEDYLKILGDPRKSSEIALDYSVSVQYVRDMRSGNCSYWPGSVTCRRRYA